MKIYEIYSLILAIISITVSLYFVQETAVQIGLVITIFIAIVSIYVIQKFKQIELNTKAIKEIGAKLNLTNRINKIEQDIAVLKEVVKMSSKKGQGETVIIILLVILIIYMILKALNKI